MSYEALVAIAPLLDATRFGSPEWERPGRDSYWGNSLQLLPGEGVPLLIDHDDARRIGTVHALYELDVGGGKWVTASATVTDPPAWLRKNTPASFRRHDTYTVESVKGAQRVGAAFVGEVSVLPPGVEPAEPLARVVCLEREKPKPHTERSHYVDLTADPGSPHWLRAAQEEAHAKGRIVRVSGQVLRVH